MSDYIQMVTTTNSTDLARRIADTLVKEKLAACVQISGPIYSVYEWKDEIQHTDEWTCFIKTRRELFPQVEERIKALHPYEGPEIIALPILEGSRDYLDWINQVVKRV